LSNKVVSENTAPPQAANESMVDEESVDEAPKTGQQGLVNVVSNQDEISKTTLLK
jgi:hypothetical protein